MIKLYENNNVRSTNGFHLQFHSLRCRCGIRKETRACTRSLAWTNACPCCANCTRSVLSWISSRASSSRRICAGRRRWTWRAKLAPSTSSPSCRPSCRRRTKPRRLRSEHPEARAPRRKARRRWQRRRLRQRPMPIERMVRTLSINHIN